jgi:outer membrane lipoprotein
MQLTVSSFFTKGNIQFKPYPLTHYFTNLLSGFRLVTFIFFLPLLTSCATPVISPGLMGQARVNLPINDLTANPIPYENHLFVFAVKIAEIKVTPEGSQLEGVYVPVDEWGRPLNIRQPNARVRALLKQEYGLLDPLIYEKGRLVTIAATFKGLQPDRLEGMNYLFPYFHIVEIYLWERPLRRYYYPYDPWFYEPPPFRFGFGYYWWCR